MTKQKIYDTTLSAVLVFVEQNKLPEAIKTGLTTILNENLAPKSGGKAINLDEVTKKVGDKITQLLCNVSHVWLPANLDHFYEDKSEKPVIVGLDGKGLKRLSKQAESVSKKFKATQKASAAAITDDILALDMSAENAPKAKELKAKLDEVKAAKPDFSVVKPIVAKAPEAA